MSGPLSVQAPPASRRLTSWIANPWAQARFLWVAVFGYLAWSLVPVFIAVAYSFNAGKAQTTWQGFSATRWFITDVNSVWQDETLRSALFQSLKLSALTVVIAVPLGVAFAIALDRWRGRGAGTSDFVMLFSFITPEIAIGVGLFLMMTKLVEQIGLGFTAQVLGLSMYELAFTVIIVRARLLSVGKHYEEAAMDLGASPTNAIRRVLLPLLSPAIFASVAIVFASAIDNFVISQRLCADASCQTIPIVIYSSARRSPLPSLNALATIVLVLSTVLIGAAVVGYRAMTRGERALAESPGAEDARASVRRMSERAVSATSCGRGATATPSCRASTRATRPASTIARRPRPRSPSSPIDSTTSRNGSGWRGSARSWWCCRAWTPAARAARSVTCSHR